MALRFFNFKSVELVHIGSGRADIVVIEKSSVTFTDDIGRHLAIDLGECARIHNCLREIGAFPPGEDLDWGAIIDKIPGFSALPLPEQGVVGLRAAVDDRPWFQFLDRRRTQFEFTDYEHIQGTLLQPMGAGSWGGADASGE